MAYVNFSSLLPLSRSLVGFVFCYFQPIPSGEWYGLAALHGRPSLLALFHGKTHCVIKSYGTSTSHSNQFCKEAMNYICRQ